MRNDRIEINLVYVIGAAGENRFGVPWGFYLEKAMAANVTKKEKPKRWGGPIGFEEERVYFRSVVRATLMPNRSNKKYMCYFKLLQPTQE